MSKGDLFFEKIDIACGTESFAVELLRECASVLEDEAGLNDGKGYVSNQINSGQFDETKPHCICERMSESGSCPVLSRVIESPLRSVDEDRRSHV